MDSDGRSCSGTVMGRCDPLAWCGVTPILKKYLLASYKSKNRPILIELFKKIPRGHNAPQSPLKVIQRYAKSPNKKIPHIKIILKGL